MGAVNKDIVGFDISVRDAHSMKVLQSTEKLAGDGFDLHFLKSSMFVDHATQITAWNILHDYIEILLPVNMFNVLNNIWLAHISSQLKSIHAGPSHMLDLRHNPHLHVDLLVQDSVLHKSSLFELFSSIWNTIVFVGNLIDNGKGTLTNGSDPVVLRSSFPLFHVSPKRGSREVWSSGVRRGKNVRLCTISNAIG